MAKPTTIKIRLNSTAGTGHFYVTKKNARTMTEKMSIRKYDPMCSHWYRMLLGCGLAHTMTGKSGQHGAARYLA